MSHPDLPTARALRWQDRGACNGMDVALFYPPSGEGKRGQTADAVLVESGRVRAAKKVCGGCVVVGDCLRYALENREIGIWGGTTDDERKTIRRRRRP